MNDTKQATLKRVKELLDAGAIQISSKDLQDMISPLGYRLGDESFCYVNNLNAGETWTAKSMTIVCVKSGKSFANIASSRKNIKQLQKIRLNYFVFEKGKLWEI